jgi:hypothetical protein|tara:strand:- start:4838 stop:5023 length:186 start_codon:yes stop_codon:yes gene_type:complete
LSEKPGEGELATMDQAGFESTEFELKFSGLEGEMDRQLILLIKNIRRRCKITLRVNDPLAG